MNMDTVMDIVFILAVAMLALAAVLTLVRAQKGPGILDRALAVDVLSSSLVGGLAIYAAWSLQTETIPILVALSLVGFIGSVTLSRFAANDTRLNKRIKTPEEIAAEEADRLARIEAEMRPDEQFGAEGSKGDRI